MAGQPRLRTWALSLAAAEERSRISGDGGDGGSGYYERGCSSGGLGGTAAVQMFHLSRGEMTLSILLTQGMMCYGMCGVPHSGEPPSVAGLPIGTSCSWKECMPPIMAPR